MPILTRGAETWIWTKIDNRDIRPTSENIHTKGARTWTPQEGNNTERRESFFLKQIYFSVNNDMQ
jgi:hypothetical protein